KIVGSVKLSGHPNNITISKDGKNIFVAIAVAPGAVDVIDAASMKNIKSIPVKGAVHNTYMTPDGKYAIAGSVAGSIITVIAAGFEGPGLRQDWSHPGLGDSHTRRQEGLRCERRFEYRVGCGPGREKGNREDSCRRGAEAQRHRRDPLRPRYGEFLV